MINQPIQVFKLMYLALQKEWEKSGDEKLGMYLSDADPFLSGNDSADPVVFLDFQTVFEKYGGYDDYGYSFILKYLEELDPYYGDVKAAFLNIDKTKYVGDSEKLSKLTDKEIIVMNHWEKYYPLLFK